MNKTRRQKLHSLFDTVSEAKKQIEMLRDEEEELQETPNAPNKTKTM